VKSKKEWRKGKLLSSKYYKKDGSILKTKEYYSKKGKFIKREIFDNGKLLRTETWE